MASDPARPFLVLCVVFGAAVIAIFAWFTAVIPSQACSGRLPAGTSAFLAYQLARTTDDIEAVFRREGDPCRADMVAALDLANKVNLIAFIATYSGFLASFSFPLMRFGYVGLPRIGLVAVAVTFVFDGGNQLPIAPGASGPEAAEGAGEPRAAGQLSARATRQVRDAVLQDLTP